MRYTGILPAESEGGGAIALLDSFLKAAGGIRSELQRSCSSRRTRHRVLRRLCRALHVTLADDGVCPMVLPSGCAQPARRWLERFVIGLVYASSLDNS